MCLIVVAHRTSERFPLVIAANRDEDHQRPTREAHFWDDAPEVLGGRDALHGGTWLAVTRGGRFAAVTNLRGAAPSRRSRGFLVSDFVRSDGAPEAFAASVARNAADYAGFHLLAGDVERSVVLLTAGEQPELLDDGLHGVSNAPAGEQWPKVAFAVESVARELHGATTADALCEALLRLFTTSRGSGRVEEELFITGGRYGTRSSTIVIATMDEIVFAEQSHASGGVAVGAPRLFRIAR